MGGIVLLLMRHQRTYCSVKHYFTNLLFGLSYKVRFEGGM